MVKWCNVCNDFRADNANFCGWCGKSLQHSKKYPNFKTWNERTILINKIKQDCDAQQAIEIKQLKLL
ncbi:hypothetical protein IJ843_04285 [bacterium]|nr:hypothetical protein [bacterium]